VSWLARVLLAWLLRAHPLPHPEVLRMDSEGMSMPPRCMRPGAWHSAPCDFPGPQGKFPLYSRFFTIPRGGTWSRGSPSGCTRSCLAGRCTATCPHQRATGRGSGSHTAAPGCQSSAGAGCASASGFACSQPASARACPHQWQSCIIPWAAHTAAASGFDSESSCASNGSSQ
jgi:hypothetical protein